MKDKEPFEDSKRPCRAPRQQDKEPRSAEISFLGRCCLTCFGGPRVNAANFSGCDLGNLVLRVGRLVWLQTETETEPPIGTETERQTDRPTDRTESGASAHGLMFCLLASTCLCFVRKPTEARMQLRLRDVM